MNAALNAVTAPDNAPSQASTMQLGMFVDHINIDVLNQAIYWQTLSGDPRNGTQQARWDQEVFMSPGSRTLNRRGVCGFRFRAATPVASLPAGSPQAVVTVEAVW